MENHNHDKNHNHQHDDDRKMYEITCSECGEKSEVPFKPDGERPVFCKACYSKKRKY